MATVVQIFGNKKWPDTRRAECVVSCSKLQSMVADAGLGTLRLRQRRAERNQKSGMPQTRTMPLFQKEVTPDENQA